MAACLFSFVIWLWVLPIPQDHRGGFATVTDRLRSVDVQASCDHKIHLCHGSAPRDIGTLQRRDGLAVQDSLLMCDRLKSGRVRALPQLIVAVEVPRVQKIVVAPKRFLGGIDSGAAIGVSLDKNRS